MGKQRKVLVTGGAGFLGSHLCDRLLERGCQVTCLDNFQTGRHENIAHLAHDPSFDVRHHDITLPLHQEVDWIFNLACPASPPAYQRNPIKTTKTSVLGALNVLGLAKRHGARVFQASTSEIYGDPEQHPQCEDYWGHVNPIGIRSCYDEGKRVAETLFYDYQRTHNLDIRVVRIFNTYGPRMDPSDGRVVSNFVAQALAGKPLTVYGDGSQTRSFCYVDDLIDGFLRLMNYEGPGCQEPHNIGNPNEFTILELADAVRDVLGRPVLVIHKPLPGDDPKMRRPDITKATKNLGWQPKVALRDGIARLADDFKSRLQPLGATKATAPVRLAQ